MAQIKSSADHPTYELVAPDGHVYHWAQHLTRDATIEEECAYWKERALRAEKGATE